ncbi:MAG TPA: tRNA pseudouridine(55) synthase TruB [Marmoricola sp.]|nr:tRNA pseudouridine(55) synthase TruB [Marmoricola sp.]
MNGLVVVDKPAGITSHDVVARVRRLAGTRKVGHAGTLDPMATGVLVVGINRATRLLGHLLLTDKAYDATIRLGATTTTDDAEGEVLQTVVIDSLPEDALRAGLAAMTGEIDQVPSAVSAIKIDGKRAYERVRAGEDVQIAARRVRISSIDLTRIEPVDGFVDLDVTVRCSSGTYIRAIARDLGAGLGVGGHLTALRRTAVGPFGIGAAHTLDELADDFTILDISDAARTSFPAYQLDDAQAAMVRVGKKLPIDLPAEGPVAVFAPDGEFLALYERGGDLARPIAVFG